MRNILTLFFTLTAVFQLAAQSPEPAPLFSFGLIADVQYADVEQAGKRDYRGSLKRLEECVRIFNSHPLSFIVHAGDLIDRHYQSFRLPLKIFGRSRAVVHYVIGNHEFAVADSLKQKVPALLKNPRGYYSFVEKGFQFILLNAMDVSLMASAKGSKAYEEALAVQQELKNNKANNSHEWNGGMGRRQLAWLKVQLQQGEKRGYETVLFSHHPLLPENGFQVWNNREVLDLLSHYPSVVAFISGHHHEGGYIRSGHIHHLTLKGLVESTSGSAGGIAEVFPDKITVRGFGDQADYTLDY